MARNKTTEIPQKKLLKIIQKNFPLKSRPFLEIGNLLNLDEEKVIEILKDFKRKKILRQISAIFNPWFFGHRSALFAFKVPSKKLEKAISIINKHPGVSHNYLRDHSYNLWFILVSLPERDLLKEAERLAELCGVSEYLYLPALRIFKISAVFEDKVDSSDGEEFIEKKIDISGNISERDRLLVKALQEPLPLVKAPFKDIANSLGIEEKEIFSWIKEMKKIGALRRFGALLKHDKLGFKTNVMVAWEVEKNKMEAIIKKLSTNLLITHCYERKVYPNWKYNLYTMCHFKKGKEKEKIPYLAKKLGIENFIILETIKELKKIRLKLFYDFSGRFY